MQKHLLRDILVMAIIIGITAYVTIALYDKIVANDYIVSVAIVVIFGAAYFAGLILHMKSQ